MAISVRSSLMASVAVAMATTLVVAPSVKPPAPESVASPAVRLSVAVEPLTPSENIPSLADQIQMGIVPSLGALVPTPHIPGPSPAPTDFEFENAIKNTYSAIEPWVRYGFEVGTYVVGWIPWVGWLSPQIMIFYNFGERIVRSLVFNSADWLWGPLPFFEGVGNIAEDSWNALVQLGRDEWNFWLPPLPPLPPLSLAAQQTTTLAADLTTVQQQPGQKLALELQSLGERLGLQSLRQHLGLPDLPARDPAGAVAATVHGLITRVEQALDKVGAEARPVPTEATETPKDVTGAVPEEVSFSVTSVRDQNPKNVPALRAVLEAPRKAADVVAAARDEVQTGATPSSDAAAAAPNSKTPHAAHAGGKALRQSLRASAAKRSAEQRRLGGDVAKVHRSLHRPAPKSAHFRAHKNSKQNN